MGGKDDGSYDPLTTWDESPGFTKIKRTQRNQNKKERPKSPNKKKKKMREKREGTMLYPFSTLVLQIAP